MNRVFIHNNNLCDDFKNRELYAQNIEVDKYISSNLILKIESVNPNIIFIKDALSEQYIDLLGLRVAMHIRLSNEKLKYLPIVIVSELNHIILQKLSPLANILITKNVFLIKNTKEAIKNFDETLIKPFEGNEYDEKFLNLIKIEPPKDYLSHHSIANEWSMYRWAEYLDVHTPDIEKIRDDISSMLYFKYLQAMFPIKRNLFARHKQHLDGSGKILYKVLYIDDEWEKGWKSIFDHIFKENENCHLETVEEIYKDKSQEEIITFIMAKVVSANPDVIILDMRLHEDDFLENIGLADLTGIQIFNKIKELNPGIQVVIFTASSNSLLLDELYSYDSSILGYVKKEHPKNYNLTTQSNINKLISLINKGLDEKYLKDIYTIKKVILGILENDIFSSYIKDINKYEKNWLEIKKETNHIFDILNSNTSNKYPYAMLSIARSLEAILSIFIIERRYDNNIYWDAEDCCATKFEDKITSLMKKFGYDQRLHDKDYKDVFGNLNNFVRKRNYYVHSNPLYKNVTKHEIEEWFNILLDVIKVIDIPPNYIPYTP